MGHKLRDMLFGKRLALFASPLDPVPSVGHVRAFEAVMSDPTLACDGILVAVAENYLPATPPILPYNTLSDRVELVRALRYVDSVTTYRSEEELYQIMAELRPVYWILPASYVITDPRPQAQGIQPLWRAELEATNYRVDLIERIKRGQH